MDALPADGLRVLDEMRRLRADTYAAYEPIMRPTRRREIVDWMFASITAAMEEAVG